MLQYIELRKGCVSCIIHIDVFGYT